MFLRYQVAAVEVGRVLAEARRSRVAAGAAMPATALTLGQLDDDDREVIAALDASYTTGSRKSAPNPEALYKAARQRQRRNAPADGADAAIAAERAAIKRARQRESRAYPAVVESASSTASPAPVSAAALAVG